MEGHFEENNSAINISDVIEVIETDPAFGSMDGTRRGPTEGATSLAYINIIEQPASKALRFRYECEGRSAGSIPGVNSTTENKTFPTVQIVGYKGRAVVVVSCVTKDQPYKPHPHNLVGKESCKKGVCTVEVNNDNMIVSFANLGIQCVKKKDIEEALKIREEIRVDPFRTGFGHKTQASSIDLNAVRLCFQAFIEGPQRGRFTVPLKPVVSEPIYDKKAMADLIICKLSHCSASVAGGKEIILLCEKVAKEDISVRFYEENDGVVVWEGLGDFTPTQVHKQVAIAFRTPRYRTLEIDQPVQALIQLRRPSDNALSDPLPFLITPLDSDPAMLKRKRQKFNTESDMTIHVPDNIPPVSVQTLPVKCEPVDTSPNPYMRYSAVNNSLSPLYTSSTPSPLEYSGTVNSSPARPTSVPTRVVYQQNVFVSPAGGVGGSTYQQYMPGTSSNVMQAPNTTEILDMDTQQYNVELNFERLNSKDLAELNVLDAGNLSANLSANLSLNDANAQSDMNMSDSITTIANQAYKEFFSSTDNP
ncbi:embryonic polarity protein dorsal-like isoform X2 [Cimex lectularius]|nr:embryonic polarity protein dorsal-like isoform X2 [Cimex lectularius]